MATKARLAVSSITYAMQAKDMLTKHGIQANIVRLQPNETPNGCAFGLEISRRDVMSAGAVLKKAEIKFTGP